MISRYREVFFGLVIGLVAVVIDVVMDARMQDRSFAEALIQPRVEMLFYRLLFLAFGVSLGWLLWKSNKGERKSRHLAAALDKLCREIAAPCIIIHTQAQMLLMRDPALSAEAESALRTIYEQSMHLQSLTNRRRSSDDVGCQIGPP